NEMKSIFKNFKSEGVNEFVLDLRYNGGGLVSCAQTLASCLAPSDIIKDSKNYFCIMKNNGKSTAKASNSYYPFNSSLTSSNLNLTKKRLYVLTGRWSASSSEAVINALKPFMDVILIGEQTLGKAVGSILFGDGDEGDKYDWIMHPIVMSICNHDGDYAYSQKGFTPDVLNDEYGLPFVKFCQLGDTNETLLSTALALIAGQTLSAPALRSSASMPTLEPVYSSVGRHVPQGLIFDEGMLEMAK
ncbi:peptidase S41, partial [Parabacteroides sp. OttesenSCG-928-J18]|nr:peptidase S41 [Parabacteroides sp. OttesenSCG-928-J18]